MGQTPAKYFPMPTPYGNSPDIGTIAQAKAASPAPLNNFLPLNPQAPPQAQPQQAPGVTNSAQGQFGGNPNINRFLGYGGGLRRNMDF